MRISRREFIRTGAAFTASTLLGARVLPASAVQQRKGPSTPDLIVVKGTDYYQSTLKAVELLGGIQRFVPKGSTVGLLVNSRFGKPGSYVKPEITLAVLSLCFSAGAKGVYSLEGLSESYWERSDRTRKLNEMIRSLREPRDHVAAEIKGGKAVKKVEIVPELLECDVFINVPVVKDHEGTRFTCTMKNMMGATSHSTNGYFHRGSNSGGYYSDVDFLSQCIADLNLLRRPTLSVVDATEFLTTNGPSGPGNIAKRHSVVAASSGVAADAYCTSFLGLNPRDIAMIRKAREHGLGETDPAKLEVKEIML